jgi:hypothetical protein
MRDLQGREVMGTPLVDGIYIASANVGGTLRTQRFIVKH